MYPVKRFVVADDERSQRLLVRRHLANLGYDVAAEAASGQSLISEALRTRPDMVIVDIRLDGMDGLHAVHDLSQMMALPFIVISGALDSLTFERASDCPVQAFLPKPIDEPQLAAAIAIARKRFEDVQLLKLEVASVRQRLADRIDVERAKGILMKRNGLNEDIAYGQMRSMARNSGQTVGQIARSMLTTEAMLFNSGSAHGK